MTVQSKKYIQIRKAVRNFDLFAYLNDHGVDFKVRSAGQYYYTTCWHCGKEDKLFIHASNRDPYKGFYRCWVCGTKGDLFGIVSKLENLTRRQAFARTLNTSEETYVEAGPILKLELEKFSSKSKIQVNQPIDLPSNFVPLVKCNQSNAGYRYAMSRGLNPELMSKFDVRYNVYMRRIIFPIKFRNEVVGWQGRAISTEITPKLMSSVGLKKNLVLFNFDNIESETSIVIVEGPIDAIKAHEHNPVALLGKVLSEEQFKLLLRLPHLKKIYLALDPDAIKEMQSLADKLYGMWQIYMVRLPKQRDIGDCNSSEINHYIKIARPYQPEFIL